MVLRKLASAGGQRALWTMLDQGLSSLATAIMSITVAKFTSQVDYGRFSLAFVIYTFMIGVQRALASTPFIIHHTGASEDDQRERGALAAALTIGLGLVGAVVAIAACAIIGGGYAPAIIMMAVFFPGVLLQDAWRMQLIAVGRPRAAVLQDTLVILLQIATFAWVLLDHHRTPVWFIVAWSVPTTLAAAFGIWQWHTVPPLHRAWSFLRAHWDTSRFLLAEYVAVQGASQIAWMLIPVLGTPQDVGALRGGMTLLGTLNIVGNSVYMFALAEILRRGITARSSLLRLGAVVTGVIAVIDAVVGGVLILLPTSWGTALLGATWVGATVTLLPLTLYMVGVAFSTGPQVVMRSRADTRSTFRVNLVLGPLMLVAVCAGQWWHGAAGAAWGFAAATVLTAPLWWAMAVRTVSRPAPTAPVAAEPAP